MVKKGSIYRVAFLNHGHLYEVYAKEVRVSDMPGFIEVTSFVFDEQQLVADTAEEKLKMEFAEVVRSFIPVHAMVRIDEVSKKGIVRIIDLGPAVSNVHSFPVGVLKDKPDNND